MADWIKKRQNKEGLVKFITITIFSVILVENFKYKQYLLVPSSTLLQIASLYLRGAAFAVE